jgi:hypothetical protein
MKEPFIAKKTGCNIYGHKLLAEYNESTREVTFTLDTLLKNVEVSTRGGVTRLVGEVAPELSFEEFEQMRSNAEVNLAAGG